jgi:DNA-directed RNA polymerase specialized sigma24 family protein
VLLFETLSNFSPLTRAMKTARESASRDGDVTIITDLRHPNRKLNPEEITALVDAYTAGEPLKGLAQRFGMHEQTVKANLRRADVALRPWPKLTPIEIDEAARRYADGWSLGRLAEIFRCDPSTIRRALARAGVVIRPRGRSQD